MKTREKTKNEQNLLLRKKLGALKMLFVQGLYEEMVAELDFPLEFSDGEPIMGDREKYTCLVESD